MIAKPDYDAENFCCSEHADIYSILSKHGCNLITADEALKELSEHNLDVKFTEDVFAHIKRIKSEATPVKTTKKEVGTPVSNTTNKNSKKKW